MIASMILSALLAASPVDSAQALMQQERFAEAAAQFAQAAAADSSYEALFGQARALAFAGEHERAAEVANDLLRRHPGDPDGLLLRGRVLAWMNRWEAAEADLLAARDAAPDYLDVRSALVDLYRWSGQEKKALAQAEAVLERDRKAASSWVLLARAQIASRLFHEARESLLTARRLGGNEETISDLLTLLARRPSPTNWEVLANGSISLLGASGTSYSIRTPAILTKRQFDWGSIAAGLERRDFRIGNRRSRPQSFGLLDIYANLWSSAYANLMARQPLAQANDPADRNSGLTRGELFQGFLGRYEASLAAGLESDPKRAGDDQGWLVGTSLALYAGPWYLRAVATHRGIGSTSSRVYQAAARNYSTADNFIDFSLYNSRVVDRFAREFEEWAGTVRIQGFRTDQFGLSISGLYGKSRRLNVDFNTTLGTILGAGLGIIYRF